MNDQSVAQLTQQSLYLEDGAHQLHVRHIVDSAQPQGQPVLMVHGAIENGRIFYSAKGKGLACYLASQGFDVYVIDLRGRGKTQPTIAPFDAYGQTETIVHDLPLFLDFVYQRNRQKIHLIAHSWGGVLLTAMFARQPALLAKVASQTYFGSKRRVSAFNFEVLVKIKLMWHTVAPRLTQRKGYLAAKKLGFGSDDETIKSHQQGMEWTKTAAWIDSDDQFDYHQACKEISWPPTWFVAAINDKALGHPSDIRRFMDEANYSQAKYTLLAKRNGQQQDYDHITMLTAGSAWHDHFVLLAQWLHKVS